MHQTTYAYYSDLLPYIHNPNYRAFYCTKISTFPTGASPVTCCRWHPVLLRVVTAQLNPTNKNGSPKIPKKVRSEQVAMLLKRSVTAWLEC